MSLDPMRPSALIAIALFTSCLAEPLPRPGGAISGAQVRADLTSLSAYGLRLGIENYCNGLPAARRVECTARVNDQWFWGTAALELGVASVQEIRPTTYYSTASSEDCVPQGYLITRLFMNSLLEDVELFDESDRISLVAFDRETARAAFLTGQVIAGNCASSLVLVGEDGDYRESFGNVLCNLLC